MATKTIWNEQFGMLMASGSPGSALAYQLGSSPAEAAFPRRNNTEAGWSRGPQPPVGPAGGLRGWLRRLLDRFEAWTYTREMREVEAYLAQAQNHADLEARMRHLHDSLLSRARTLR